MIMARDISRRAFLKGTTGALGLTIAATVTPMGLSLVNASSMSKEAMKGLSTSAFYTVTPDNMVNILVPSSEMGQGIHTTLPMIVADELEADWAKVKAAQAPAAKDFMNPLLRSQLTVASASTRGWYDILRKAGAAGRMMLREAAAKQWKVPVAECVAEMSVVKHKSGKSATYGELALAAAKLPVPENPPLKKESQFRYMGKHMDRVDIPAKVGGTAVFGYDIQLPGMLCAVSARPPAYGAKPEKFDEKAAKAVKGVAAVIPTPFGVAVVAKDFMTALKGREALAVKWSAGAMPKMDNALIEKALFNDVAKGGANALTRGDPAGALKKAAKVVEAEYYVPCVAHSTMEPMNFTAHVQNDRCDLYGPTQAQTISQMLTAKVTKLPPEKIFVHTSMLGCGLGRRGRPEFVIEAVICSKATGKPVKMCYTREDDIKHDFFRAPAAHVIKAGLDKSGNLIGWQHKLGCISISQYLGRKIKDGVDSYCLWGLVDPPQSPTKSQWAYTTPNFSVDLSLSKLPVPVTPWRSVQNGPNAFGTECFMDELAHAAGKDPVQFRLSALEGNPRAQRAVKTVAKNAKWGSPLPKGRARGIAQHACFGSYIAQVAEVSLTAKGSLKIHRVDVAVDCGPIVNPDALKAQIEGAVTMACSTVLKEEVMFKHGGVASANWDDYGLIRMSEVPDIHVHLIKNNDPIGGIGEPGIPPLAPAVANAFFSLTGKRVRRMPLSQANIAAAMKG
jgi:isoquinoline 1-oxidoreductase beta subunit